MLASAYNTLLLNQLRWEWSCACLIPFLGMTIDFCKTTFVKVLPWYVFVD